VLGMTPSPSLTVVGGRGGQGGTDLIVPDARAWPPWRTVRGSSVLRRCVAQASRPHVRRGRMCGAGGVRRQARDASQGWGGACDGHTAMPRWNSRSVWCFFVHCAATHTRRPRRPVSGRRPSAGVERPPQRLRRSNVHSPLAHKSKAARPQPDSLTPLGWRSAPPPLLPTQ